MQTAHQSVPLHPSGTQLTYKTLKQFLCHEQTLNTRSGDLCTVRLGQCSTAMSWDHQEKVETSWWEQDELGRKEELLISGWELHRAWLRAGQLDLEMQVPQRCCLSRFADPRQLKIEASR